MRKFILLPLLIFVAACENYSLVQPGPTAVGGLKVQPVSVWNKTVNKFAGREYWTQNGMLLDRITFIDGIEDGKPLFKAAKHAEYGVFRANMLPNEVMELTESSLSKLVSSAAISTEELKPGTFGGSSGFRFDYKFISSSDVPMKGIAAGTIKNGRLYMILYHAPEAYYFDKGLPEAEEIIRSASPV